MMTSIRSPIRNLGRRANQRLKQWTKPATATLLTGTLSDITRSRADLIAENLMLRQQLIVLSRQGKRPLLTDGDRIRLVLLARAFGGIPPHELTDPGGEGWDRLGFGAQERVLVSQQSVCYTIVQSRIRHTASVVDMSPELVRR